MVLFSVVTYENSTVDCSGGPHSLLPFAECAVWGSWCLLIAVWLLDNNQILILLVDQKAHPSLRVYLCGHLQIGRPSYSITPNRPGALLG